MKQTERKQLPVHEIKYLAIIFMCRGRSRFQIPQKGLPLLSERLLSLTVPIEYMISRAAIERCKERLTVLSVAWQRLELVSVLVFSVRLQSLCMVDETRFK